jgi:hypothetical protein
VVRTHGDLKHHGRPKSNPEQIQVAVAQNSRKELPLIERPNYQGAASSWSQDTKAAFNVNVPGISYQTRIAETLADATADKGEKPAVVWEIHNGYAASGAEHVEASDLITGYGRAELQTSVRKHAREHLEQRLCGDFAVNAGAGEATKRHYFRGPSVHDVAVQLIWQVA